MTAQVIELLPTGERADETVRRTIKALIEGRDLNIEDVADRAGLARATLYRRLSGHGSKQAFKAGEVATLAAYLGVRIEAIYSGLGGTFIPPTDDERARRYSKPQPSDPKVVVAAFGRPEKVAAQVPAAA